MELEAKKPKQQPDQCGDDNDLLEAAHRLKEEGRRLHQEANHLDEQATRLEEEARRLEEEAREHGHDCEEDRDKNLFMFVNRLRFDHAHGAKSLMSVEAIAALVGKSIEDHVVRRLLPNGDTSDPLSGDQHVKRGDQFFVTRKKVEGGFEDRIAKELSLLRESSQAIDYVPGSPGYVIYRQVPTSRGKVDVIVPVPSGYPHGMIDRAGLPEGHSFVGQVKGSPQEVVSVGGQNWRMISYHPHQGGGGELWDPSKHGFHTYLSEVVAWLEVMK